MRMWLVDTKWLCRKHLLGEHLEMHMFLGTIKKNKSLNGFIKNKLVVVSKIIKRHNDLVKEMKKREYNHKSKIKFKNKVYFYIYVLKIKLGLKNNGFVDIKINHKELIKRCKDCKNIYKRRKNG